MDKANERPESAVGNEGVKKKLVSMMGPVCSILVPFLVGALVMVILHESPLTVYVEMLKGALVGKLNIGTTLTKFTDILLLGVAFALSQKVRYFNLGLEGCIYMGAMAAAYVGYAVSLPRVLHLPLCLLVGMVAGGLWGLIPGYFKLHYNMSEACSTIMFNYVALYFTGWLVNNPLNSHMGMPQTKDVLPSAALTQLLRPSNLNTGIFIALIVFAIVYFICAKTKTGFKIQSVGLNPVYSDYIGFPAKKIALMVIVGAGAIAGMCGSIDIIGVHDAFIEGYVGQTMFQGLLCSLLVRNDMKKLPISALFIAILSAGAMGMERNTGISRALVDTIINLIFLFVAMDTIFDFTKRVHKKAKVKVVNAASAGGANE